MHSKAFRNVTKCLFLDILCASYLERGTLNQGATPVRLDCGFVYEHSLNQRLMWVDPAHSGWYQPLAGGAELYN